MNRAPYYKTSIAQMPWLTRYKGYQVSDLFYEYSPKCDGHYCEFSFIQEGTLHETRGGATESFCAGTVHTAILEDGLIHHADPPVYHAFEAGLLFHTPCEPMTEEQVLQWIPAPNEVLLCRQVSDPVVVARLEKHIKAAILAYHSGLRDRFVSAKAEMMQVLRIMTTHAMDRVHRINGDQPRRKELCLFASNYVAAHLSQPILGQDIARALGVAPSYLSRIFSQSMGMPLTEYIHRAKLQQVIHLILDGGADLRQAADAVGIASTKYLSRLFRQYMGMTVTEYKKLHDEASQKRFLIGEL